MVLAHLDASSTGWCFFDIGTQHTVHGFFRWRALDEWPPIPAAKGNILSEVFAQHVSLPFAYEHVDALLELHCFGGAAGIQMGNQH